MKKLLLLILISLGTIVKTNAQCSPSYLTTYPTSWDWASYFTINNIQNSDQYFNPSWKKNYFDWTTSNTYKFYDNSGTTINLTSPFMATNEPYLQYLNWKPPFSGSNAPQIKDMSPEDGWELVKQDFGYTNLNNTNILNASTSTHDPNSHSFPYLILLNRFTGKMRVIAYGPDAPYHHVNVILRFTPSTDLNGHINTKVSALFSKYAALGQALDKKTIYKYAKTMAIYNTIDNALPFFADFDLGYDPCSCIFDTPIEVDFEFLETANINLYGTLNQDFTSLTDQNIPSYIASVVTNPTNSNDYSITTGMLNYPTADALQQNLTLLPNANKLTLSAGLQYYLSAFSTAIKSDLDLSVLRNIYTENTWQNGTNFNSLIGGSNLLNYFTATKDRGIFVNISSSAVSGENRPYSANLTPINLGLPGNPANLTGLGSSSEFLSLGKNLYPIYNKVPGVFALIETPQLLQFRLGSILLTDGYAGGFRYFLATKTEYNWKLNKDILYTLNQAANISDHVLMGAIQIAAKRNGVYAGGKIGSLAVITPYGLTLDYYEGIQNLGETSYYTTQYVSIEGLKSLVPAFTMTIDSEEFFQTVEGGTWINNKPSQPWISAPRKKVLSTGEIVDWWLPTDFFTFEARIKLMLVANHQSPSQAIKQFKSSYTFLADTIQTNTRLNTFTRNGSETDLTLSNSHYTSNNEQVGINVNIVGNLSSDPNVKTIIRAQNSITAASESSLEGEFELIIGYPVQYVPKINPVSFSSADLTSYCNGSSQLFKPYTSNAEFRNSTYLSSNEYQALDFPNTFNLKTLTAHPNPVWSTTTLSYKVANQGNVKLYITDGMGQTIEAILSNPTHEAGEFELKYSNQNLASGMYFVVLEADGSKETIKLAVVR